MAVWKATLTLAFIFDTALGLGLELGLDAVEQLVEALGWAGLGTAHDTRGIVVHGRDVYALVDRVRRRISRPSASRRGLLTGLCESTVCDGGSRCLPVARLLSQTSQKLSRQKLLGRAGPLVGATAIGWMKAGKKCRRVKLMVIR